MKKADVVNLLSRKRGYRSYLEIATPSSGKKYGDVDRGQLSCQRLLYRCAEDFADSLPVDFRTTEESSAPIVSTILAGQTGKAPYDVVFVDSLHTYRASMEDILGGYCLLRPGGMLVVHDCKPPHEGLVGPEYRVGFWSGVSYQAFVDFTLPRRDAQSFTVDCDYGCGVVFKPEDSDGARDRAAFDWFCARREESEAFRHFEKHPSELLRLKSVREFVAEHDLPFSSLKAAVKGMVETVSKLAGR